MKVALANGDIRVVSPGENSDIFFATIGGYGGVSIILEATLRLKDNIPLARSFDDMGIENYPEFFKEKIRDNTDVVFHNGDIYPPHYSKVRATSWTKTERSPTPKERLIPRNGSYRLHRYVYAIIRL